MKINLLFLVFSLFAGSLFSQSTMSFKIDRNHNEIIEKKVIQNKDLSLVYLDDRELFAYFPGGDGATTEKLLIDYINKHLIYPDSARKIGLEGKVMVQFEVGKTGKVANVKILSGGNPIFNNEIFRLFSTMPDWVWDKKIKIGDRKTVVRIIPITFSLTD